MHIHICGEIKTVKWYPSFLYLTRTKPNCSAVVRNQGIFVVNKTTSNVRWHSKGSATQLYHSSVTSMHPAHMAKVEVWGNGYKISINTVVSRASAHSPCNRFGHSNGKCPLLGKHLGSMSHKIMQRCRSQREHLRR